MELSDVGEHVFAAECIMMSRMNKSQVEYLIKWKGWGHKYNTWEPEKNIIDKRLLKEFRRKQSKRNGEATARRSVLKAKKVSIEGVKRPRGRPPLPETLRRRMQQKELELSREATKTPNADKRLATQTSANSMPSPPAVQSSPEPTPATAKKRPKQGPRGMARLLNRPRSKVKRSGKSSPEFRPASAELSPPKTRMPEAGSVESPGRLLKTQSPELCEEPVEVAAGQSMPSLSSPIWQPASKRVLDAVCVTDITACSGVTITVRESSIVDGFFRSQDEKP